MISAILNSVLLVLVTIGTALAAPTDYQISGVGSGTLGKAAFSNDSFTITMFGNPTASGSTSTSIDPLNYASVSIDGLGTTSLLIPTRIGICLSCTTSGNLPNVVYFSRTGLSGADLFDFLTAQSTLVAPFSVKGEDVFALHQFKDVTSSLGKLSFDSSTEVQFSATAVAEPSSGAMLLAGLGVLGLIGGFGRKSSRC